MTDVDEYRYLPDGTGNIVLYPKASVDYEDGRGRIITLSVDKPTLEQTRMLVNAFLAIVREKYEP